VHGTSEEDLLVYLPWFIGAVEDPEEVDPGGTQRRRSQASTLRCPWRWRGQARALCWPRGQLLIFFFSNRIFYVGSEEHQLSQGTAASDLFDSRNFHSTMNQIDFCTNAMYVKSMNSRS